MACRTRFRCPTDPEEVLRSKHCFANDNYCKRRNSLNICPPALNIWLSSSRAEFTINVAAGGGGGIRSSQRMNQVKHLLNDNIVRETLSPDGA